MVTLLKGSIGWLSISPKMHILLFHSPDVLELWDRQHQPVWGEGAGSMASPFRSGAVKYPVSTELERAAEFMRSMTLARESGADVLAFHATKPH